MGLSFRQHVRLWHCALAVCLICGAGSASADTIRVATFNTDLSRKGPGLMLRDILRGEDPQVQAVVSIIRDVAPDILLLQNLDYDHGLAGLGALRDLIREHGQDYPFMFARPPNSGRASGADLDGDGRLGEPEDAHSYGWFSGAGGMAILSNIPILVQDTRDFSDLLWADIPDPLWPDEPLPGLEVQRFSTRGHWVVPFDLGDSRLWVFAFHATPPVFDGPEDRNGRRNHDEIRFWTMYMDGLFGDAPAARFIIMGDANLDPEDSDGRKEAIRALLTDPRVQDPKPRRMEPPAAAPAHQGDPYLDTAAWPEPDPGHLRVSYILPSADLAVQTSGVHWPMTGPKAKPAAQASRHRMVWVDIAVDP